MPETDFDNIELLDDPESEEYVRMRRTDQQSLRDAANNGKKARKELDGYKRRDAISTAGLTDLTEKQRSALAQLVEDATPENLRAEAEALGWVEAVVDPNAVTDAELDAHAQVAAAGTGAPATASPRHITPQDTAEWATEKHLRLNERYPHLHEALRRGQSIDLPPDFN